VTDSGRRDDGTERAEPVRVVVVEGPERAAVREEPEPPLAEGRFRLRTRYSGVSAGTELAWFKGTSPFLDATWDPGLGLFQAGRPGGGYPVRKMGYMEVGRVTDSRTTAVPEGALVAMPVGHRTVHHGDPATEHVVPVPEDLDPVLGVYVAHLGPICANGLLHAAAEAVRGEVLTLGDGVRGRHVLVTGGGVIGLLTGLLAAHHGAAEVVVADPAPERRAAAEALGLAAVDDDAGAGRGAGAGVGGGAAGALGGVGGGAAEALGGAGDDLARTLKLRWRHGPSDSGADVVFQCRGRAESLALALRALRPQGTVVDLAFYQGGAGAVRLGEEFHHNGLGLRCAQIGRVPRGLAHLWDRRRLSLETLALLRARGGDVRRTLVSDVLPLAEAPTLYADIAARRRHVLTAVLDCA